MVNMKTGLSYFENGGEVGQPAALTRPVTPKGKFAVSSPVGAVPMSEGVLQNMQRMIEQRQSQQQGLGGFIETLKDATAWTSGGVHGPTDALSKRAIDKENRAAELFQLQNQLAQQKAAQAQLANLRAEDQKSGWGMPQAGGATTPGATTPGVSAPVEGAPSAEIVEQYNRILYTQGVAEANKFRNKYLEEKSKASFNPNLDPMVEFEWNGQFKTMKLSQAQALASRDPEIAKFLRDAGVPVKTSAAAPSAAAPSAAAPSAAAPSAAAPVEIKAPTTTVPATSQVGSGSGVRTGSGVGSGSTTAAKANIQAQTDINTERGKKRVGNEEERLNVMIEQGKKAVERADTASRINAIAEADPEMYGVLAKPGVVSSVGTLLKEGIKVGTHGQIALPSIEENVRQNQKTATPEKLSRAREMDGYLRRVELDFSSAFKGQGAVSDNERKIVQAIAGSTSDPADLLRKKAAWLANSAQKDKDMKAAWEKFTNTYGETVPYSRFERSSVAKQVTAAYEDRLRKQFESEIKAYGNRPLVSAEEYDRGAIQKGGSKSFKPSDSQKALVNRYIPTGKP